MSRPHVRCLASRRRPGLAELTPMLGTGGVLTLRTLFLTGTLTAAAAVAASMGPAQVAAHQVVAQTWFLLALVVDSLAIAAQAITGKALGAGEVDRTRAATTLVLRWGLVVGIVLGVLVLLLRTVVGPLFSPDEAVQAAIAAVHAEAADVAATDWAQIVALYDVLLQMSPSPIVELNRAVAVAMRDGPAAGLALVDAILARGELASYHLAHSARADLCRRLGRAADASVSYEQALELTQQGPERRFLERRLGELVRS